MRKRSLSLFAIVLCAALVAAIGVVPAGAAVPRPQKVFGPDIFEPDDSLPAARVLPTVSDHTFDTADDQDWFKITAEDTGTPFVLEAMPLDGGKVDTYLHVYDLQGTDGVEIANNEDRPTGTFGWGPPTYASSLLFRAPHAGTFYVAVKVSDSSDGPGEYRLFVNQGISRRLAGMTRFGTAATVSRTVWPDAGLPSYADGEPGGEPAGPDTVIVANGWNFADGLAGVPFAAKMDTTLLLSDPMTLNVETRDEISRLLRNAYWGHHDTTVYVLGGPNVVSEAVVQAIGQIEEVDRVQRIFGPNRAATAAAIAAENLNPPVGPTSIRPQVAERVAFVCNGFADADALSAGPVAGWVGGSVLFVNKTSIPASTTAMLPNFNHVVIVGGTSVVSSAVASQVASILPTATVERVWGADRFKTSKALAEWGVARGMTAGGVVLASGWAWPDGLSAGPLAYQLGGPLLLTSPTALSPEVSSFLNAHGGRTKVSYVIGSANVVSAGTATSFTGLAGLIATSR